MRDMDVEGAIEKITVFLEKWYPSEVAPYVVKKQIQMIGAIREKMTKKDIELLLSRIEMVILPFFMEIGEARREIIMLKKEIGLRI